MRDYTPKYVLVMGDVIFFKNNVAVSRGRMTPIHWRGRLPTVAQLEKEVMAYVVSTYPGYVNEHLSKMENGIGYGIQIPGHAYIQRNTVNGEVLVEWKAAPFTVLPNAADYPKVKKMADLV